MEHENSGAMQDVDEDNDDDRFGNRPRTTRMNGRAARSEGVVLTRDREQQGGVLLASCRVAALDCGDSTQGTAFVMEDEEDLEAEVSGSLDVESDDQDLTEHSKYIEHDALEDYDTSSEHYDTEDMSEDEEEEELEDHDEDDEESDFSSEELDPEHKQEEQELVLHPNGDKVSISQIV